MKGSVYTPTGPGPVRYKRQEARATLACEEQKPTGQNPTDPVRSKRQGTRHVYRGVTEHTLRGCALLTLCAVGARAYCIAPRESGLGAEHQYP